MEIGHLQTLGPKHPSLSAGSQGNFAERRRRKEGRRKQRREERRFVIDSHLKRRTMRKIKKGDNIDPEELTHHLPA
jgi:hypothetical protein